ncbi:MAG: hypothetical protein U0794_13445 [Isosphaeraceae bacterium]
MGYLFHDSPATPRRSRVGFLLLFPLALAVGTRSEAIAETAAHELRPGDRVMTLESGTRLKVESEVTATLSAGSVFRVERVKGKWVWIDSGNVRGWVKAEALVPFESAVAELSQKLAEKPDDARLHIARGLARLASREYEGAEADFSAALERDPDSTWAYHNRAVSRYMLGRLDAAQADADEAVRREPDDPSHRATRASILYARKDFVAATEAYGEALGRLKGKEAYLDDSGAEGEPGRARGRLCSAKWTCARAECWLARNRPEKALADYETALKLDAKDFATFNSLSWLLATHPESLYRNARRALELATKACELTDFNNHLALDTLAAACAEAGDFASAARWQTRAIQIADGDRSVTDNYYARLRRYLARTAYHEEALTP